jgi:hypothetical protein
MTTFPNSPRLLKGGIALLDPETSAVVRMIALQYNPDTVTRSLTPQVFGGDGADRTEAVRLKGPPTETIKLEVEIDATDQMEQPEQNQATVQNGIQPQLAALELILYPSSETLQANNARANSGTLEIVPMLAPLTVFIWSKSRVVPVRLTELSITEEAFDPTLNPLRAKISLGMRVLNVSDLGFSGRAASLYLAYQQQKERIAGLSRGAVFGDFGLQGLP